MSRNLDDARGYLQDAARSVFREMGKGKTDDQQETLALMEKGINEVKALIGNYEGSDGEPEPTKS